MIKSFSKIFNEFTKLNNIYCGKILKCVVISISKNFVIVDSGLKSESVIPISEFIDNNILEVNVGDEIDLLLDSIENGLGKTILSRKKAKIYKSWIKLEKYYKEEIVVKGKVIEKVKGGFMVLIENMRSFLPGSLIDFKTMNSDLEGKYLELKIVKLDKKNNNIILSRKAVIQLENYFNKEEFLNNIKINNIINGTVKNITDYGVFIDLGYIDGLLHITDITWKRIKHPSEIVKLGEEINVKILNFDKKSSRISLGLKQLTPDPWININEKYPKHTKIFGKVTNLVDYGFFVEIEDGIEGLVHISEMDWKQKNLHPSKIVSQNQNIEVMILDINVDNRRISLGLKQCKDNPLKIFSEKYKVGDKIYGKIKSITEFGIFVEINENIDGLIHISDLTWLIENKKSTNVYNKGDEILSLILQIDNIKSRISLGVKQLTKDPFEKYINKFKREDIVEGIIYYITNEKILVKLNDFILGEFINYENNDIEINKIFKFKILNFNKILRLVNLKII